MQLELEEIRYMQTRTWMTSSISKDIMVEFVMQILESIDAHHGIITEDTHLDIKKTGIGVDSIIRDHYTREYGFVYLYEKFVNDLAEYLKGKKVLSIMSGSCTLEKHLKDRGVDIICTDSGEWYDIPEYREWTRNTIPVEMLDAVEAIHKYGNDVDYVLCSWPPYNESGAYDAIMAMREATNPNLTMIYIGEDVGGCCADNDFFKAVCETEISTPETDYLQDTFKRFYGIYDTIRFFK